MDYLDDSGWVVSNSYEIGRYVFGIRTNSEPVAHWLDEYLGPFEIDEEAEPLYSLRMAEKGAGGSVKRFHILYRESRAIARSFDPADLGRALLSELEGLLFEGRDDALYARLGAVVTNGTVAVVSSRIVTHLDRAGRRVQRAGLTLGDALAVAIDPETGRLIPTKPILEVPGDAPEGLRSGGTGAGNVRYSIGRPTPVDIVFGMGAIGDSLAPAELPITVYRLATDAVNLGKLGLPGLEGLAKLVEGARCFELGSAGVATTLTGFARGFGLE